MDLVENIYKPLGIRYIFHKGVPLIARSDSSPESSSLEGMNLLKKFRLLTSLYNDYEFFIFNGYNTSEFLYFFTRNLLTGGKKIIAVESDTKLNPRSGLKAFIKKTYLSFLFSRPFLFGFAGGNHTHKELFRHYGMAEERIFLLPMMVDNAKFRFRGERASHPFVFLFVGRMIPLKNIELLVTAFLGNFENDPHTRLRIVGGGELFEPLKKKYGHHENIDFLGPRHGKELVETYHTSHVLVLPSDREQWGLVVNEALAAGLPVIASDRVGAIYDLIENRGTGFVFDPQKEGDLAEKMKTIRENRELYKKMGANAAQLMEKEWNYTLYRNNLLDALKKGAKRVLKREKA
ncbi:glycosyltransferase family 4 protein [Hydrogenimonas sp. SS33]|uniref:glycosyltransferase family 4 protein n=1 Tax=Hydrogenimonas leucolamina TaxID=2954236 RepID=UPI00336C25B1